MSSHKLREFYLWAWGILSILFVGAYLSSGAQEGYFVPVLLELVFAGTFALVPTAIYFVFTHKSN